MSKASEWARAYYAAYGSGKAPDIWLASANAPFTKSHHFIVSPHGDLEMGGYSLDAGEAIKFAHWILDTFEDRRTRRPIP